MENAKQAYPIIDEIAGLIGDSATLVFIGEYAGRTIIPSVHQHEIAGLIGADLTKILANYFRRVPIYIPMCRRTARAVRNKAIVDRFDELTKRQSARIAVLALAKEFATSERNIWRILKRGGE